MKTAHPMPAILRDLVARIVAGYAPQRIILFGSYARGEEREDSDIDLLIVKDTDERPIDRWMAVKRLVRDRNRKVPVCPLVYTPREIEQRLAIQDFFIQEVLEEGEVLYG